MLFNSPPLVATEIKREAKVSTLKAFIISRLPRTVEAGTDGTLTMLAVSVESPVAQALVELAPEIAARGFRVRAIFHSIEPENTPRGWTVSGPAIAFERDVRWARNPRLADAHEQLVLSADMAWVGDCLRRDWNRTDSYEQRVVEDAATVSTLARCFERLWGASEPLPIMEVAVASAGAIATLHATARAATAEAAMVPVDDDAPLPQTRQ